MTRSQVGRDGVDQPGWSNPEPAGPSWPVIREQTRSPKPPRHWSELGQDERDEALKSLGVPGFRARQLSKHYFEHADDDPVHWTDIPKAERQLLRAAFFPELLVRVRQVRSEEGTTVKTLWQLHDGALIESVLMRYGVPGVKASGTGRLRATVCVSTQVGCGMGCPFCATGQGGLQRNLSAGEIVAQVVAAAGALRRSEVPGGVGPVTNVVFMGMGEPLANYEAVMSAVRTITSPDGLGISARGLTVSTVGLVPAMARLAAEGVPLTLAVSLHAPDDDLRNELVPINKRYPVSEVLDAAFAFFQKTGRRISIEYALVKDINDQPWRAQLLASKLNQRGRGWVHVNLIPLNPTLGSKWTAASPVAQREFVRRLELAQVPVTVRDTRGREVDAACGQLAAQF